MHHAHEEWWRCVTTMLCRDHLRTVMHAPQWQYASSHRRVPLSLLINLSKSCSTMIFLFARLEQSKIEGNRRRTMKAGLREPTIKSLFFSNEQPINSMMSCDPSFILSYQYCCFLQRTTIQWKFLRIVLAVVIYICKAVDGEYIRSEFWSYMLNRQMFLQVHCTQVG